MYRLDCRENYRNLFEAFTEEIKNEIAALGTEPLTDIHGTPKGLDKLCPRVNAKNPHLLPEKPRNRQVQAFAKGTKADIRYGGLEAEYNFIDDRISLPEHRSFESDDGFSMVVFHELAHWTGHETRLNRDGYEIPMNRRKHINEEIVAESASFLLCSLFGIQPVRRHAKYLAWLLVSQGLKIEEIEESLDEAIRATEYLLFLNGYGNNRRVMTRPARRAIPEDEHSQENFHPSQEPLQRRK